MTDKVSEMMKEKGGFNDRLSSYLFISENISPEIEERLSDYFARIIRLRASSFLPASVASHADMLLFSLGESLLSSDEYIRENKDLFADVNICPVGTIGREYPHDILLDALPMGEYLFCRADSTAQMLLDRYKVINVRQGYARCSCVRINENALITADRGIADAARAHGIDSLLISAGGVSLKGYSCGFIGGASIALNERTIGFFGDVRTHRDYEKMKAFAASYGVALESLCGGELKDMGGGVAFG